MQNRFFSSLLAIFLSFVYFYWRSFTNDNQLTILISVLGLSLFIINFPGLIKNSSRQIYVCFLNIIFVIAIGIISAHVNFNLAILFIIPGFLLFLRIAFAFIKTQRIEVSIFLIILFLAFSLWVSSMAWGLGFHTPLFFEGLSKGFIHLDSLSNSAISQMIKTYGTASTGLDGTPYVFYHWGSNWIFAQFSNLLKISPALFYQLGFQIIFIPLFFNVFLYFIQEIRQFFKIKQDFNFIFWLLMMIVFIGFFPISITGVFDRVIFFSESYLLSVIFTFIFLPLVFNFIKNRKFVQTAISFSVYATAVGFLKISTAFLIVPCLLFLIFRLKIFSFYKLIFIAIVSVCSLFFVYYFVNARFYGSTGGFYLFYFLKNNVLPGWKQFFFLTNYFVFYIYFIFRIQKEKIYSLSDLWNSIKKRKLIDVEGIALLNFLGFIPGNIIKIDSGAAIYFMDFGRWISLAFLLAYFPKIAVFSPKINLRKIEIKNFKIKYFFISIFVFPFAVSFFLDNYKLPILNLFHRNKIILNAKKSVKKEQMIDALIYLDSISIRNKKKSLLYIPFSNKDYWNFTECLSVSFIAPAITGIAMINGMPPLNCYKNLNAYGYESYGEGSSSEKLKNETGFAKLCQKALSMNFSRIIVLKSRFIKDLNNVSCKK